ncbi:Sugar phosphate permease [Thermomonospora echinospora]|uniref:Sugar phosphate permease n=1 Tax=Thermomonospora echinospora TaxID=1992 RepID=A0A1H6CSB9_9ACTN|nr:MFS transporter [Thermomonospora echinospora]SEG75940.1 Sugar phosphate permease [Thermomonospora echinospora]
MASSSAAPVPATTTAGTGRPPHGVLTALCITEITSWGVLYYAFPVLAPAITVDTGWSTPAITAAFSAALVIAALVGIPVGRLLDRHGPHALMTTGSVLATTAVVGLALAPSLAWFAVAWMLAGVAQAAVLYQPAFAALTRYYGPRHLAALTTLTLVAGLASTVFAPLTDALAAHLSWRGVYLTLAAILAAVTIPLHALALRRPWPPPHNHPHHDTTAAHHRTTQVRRITRSRPFWMLAAALTLSAFAMYAVLTNLITLLTTRGATPTTAAWALGLGGLGQVAGRLGYGALTRRTTVRSRTVGILALSAATTAALAVLPGPVVLLVTVAVLAGTTRGIATLLQATAVTDRWGTASYATLSGILAAPTTIAGAIAPWAGAALATTLGGYPALFALLAVIAAIAAVLAIGSCPRFR